MTKGAMLIELNEAVTNDYKIVGLLSMETGISSSMIIELLSNDNLSKEVIEVLYKALIKIEETKQENEPEDYTI